ncbi:hypothetical protein [Domibacillus iocasae]|uniref:hypothetical protein n=1 Tax=Domibacillus iocasae TaxID=1714016 RepID=UPI001FE032AF|nr:hypothetical protein [Domibacillus iocasae]
MDCWRGEVLDPLLQAKLVDAFIIQVAPSIIGSGISLCKQGNQENDLTLVGSGATNNWLNGIMCSSSTFKLFFRRWDGNK